MISRTLVIVACLLCVVTSTAQGQAQERDLTEEVAEVDALAFAAFNDRDVDRLMKFISRDLEFFHDQDGVSGYDEFVSSSRRLFSTNAPLRRRLVPGSLQVHPIPGYGAIQIGRHEFCHWENGRDDCGVFGFTHVWKRSDDGWQITRVLSYGH